MLPRPIEGVAAVFTTAMLDTGLRAVMVSSSVVVLLPELSVTGLGLGLARVAGGVPDAVARLLTLPRSRSSWVST